MLPCDIKQQRKKRQNCVHITFQLKSASLIYGMEFASQ